MSIPRGRARRDKHPAVVFSRGNAEKTTAYLFTQASWFTLPLTVIMAFSGP
jgi:hypothetical protein